MKITLITGSANGLGKELAYIYAQKGNNLLLIDIDEIKLEEVRKNICFLYPNIYIDTIVADLSDCNLIEQIFSYTKEKNYFINNLINSAGFGDLCDFDKMKIEEQVKMVNLNCTATLFFTYAFSLEMLERNEGHIINISSLAGFMPGPYMSTYHASKSFVLSLGEAVSYEYKKNKSKVKVLTLCPGPFRSKFVERAHNNYTFSILKPMSAEKVARIAYKKSQKGKNLFIVGFKNKMLLFFARFMPRKIVTKISAKMLKHNS